MRMFTFKTMTRKYKTEVRAATNCQTFIKDLNIVKTKNTKFKMLKVLILKN